MVPQLAFYYLHIAFLLRVVQLLHSGLLLWGKVEHRFFGFCPCANRVVCRQLAVHLCSHGRIEPSVYHLHRTVGCHLRLTVKTLYCRLVVHDAVHILVGIIIFFVGIFHIISLCHVLVHFGIFLLLFLHFMLHGLGVLDILTLGFLQLFLILECLPLTLPYLFQLTLVMLHAACGCIILLGKVLACNHILRDVLNGISEQRLLHRHILQSEFLA